MVHQDGATLGFTYDEDVLRLTLDGSKGSDYYGQLHSRSE